MDDTEEYFYNIIGSLSEDNEIHTFEDSNENITDLPFKSIDILNFLFFP